MKFYIYPIAGDGIDNIPTQPDPVAEAEVGPHIAAWLQRYARQGYYSNAKQERIPITDLTFRLEQAIEEEEDVQPPPPREKILFGQRSLQDEEERWTGGTDMRMEPA